MRRATRTILLIASLLFVSVHAQSQLPASATSIIDTDVAPTNYALGVGVSNAAGHPRLGHGGAVAGFVSSNTVWLDQGAAVVVLTNLDGSDFAGSITNQIAPLLLAG